MTEKTLRSNCVSGILTACFAPCFAACFAACLAACPVYAYADPVPVRIAQGTVHAFLELRAEDGRVIASGDLTQVVRSGRVRTHVVFRFKDGSTDDETTVFLERRNLQLISDRHTQAGPAFPHPIEVSIDCTGKQVTVRSPNKDGKEEVKTEHLDLPPDLANGMVPVILENLPPNAPEKTVSMIVATPKPRLVKLVIASRGEDPFVVDGASHQAIHDEIRIELGGLPGVVAPLIGKQPPNIQAWTIGGDAPTFLREQGPIYPDGPIMTIQLISPVWPVASRAAH